jgi:hypothetical protein
LSCGDIPVLLNVACLKRICLRILATIFEQFGLIAVVIVVVLALRTIAGSLGRTDLFFVRGVIGPLLLQGLLSVLEVAAPALRCAAVFAVPVG